MHVHSLIIIYYILLYWTLIDCRIRCSIFCPCHQLQFFFLQWKVLWLLSRSFDFFKLGATDLQLRNCTGFVLAKLNLTKHDYAERNFGYNNTK